MARSVDPAFWKSKRVLVTGHTGFKGSWLSLWLQDMGAIVCGVSLAPSTSPAMFDVAHVASGMEHHIGDIRSFSLMQKRVSEFLPDILIHLAAQPLVRLSYREPVETYATNVMGTIHVLEAARHSGSVRAIVNVTTDKSYENEEWEWGYRENDPVGGHDPYSSSKGCAELVSAAYRRSFLQEANVAMATARAGNVIGGGDWADDRLLPDILRSLEKADPVQIRNPNAIRPWQHVLEPLSGYLVLAEDLFEKGHDFAEAWNFGPLDEDAKKVEWIANQTCDYWGGGVRWEAQPGDHPHEANFLKLDISKAGKYLDWKPRWPLQTALAATVDWHRAWLRGKDMAATSLDQIAEYQASTREQH